MQTRLTRRGFLWIVPLSLIPLSGCFGIGNPAPGSLTIQNDHSEPHTVTVSVLKDDKKMKEETFVVDSGQKIVEEGILDQEGQFSVHMSVDTGDESTMEVRMSQGEFGLGGESLRVRIFEDGQVAFSAPIHD